MATKKAPSVPPSLSAPPIPSAGELPFLTPQRTRLIGFAGGAVLLIALVIWFFVTLGQRKEVYAAQELEKGRAMAEQTNLGGAAAQFEKVMTDYRGSSAAFDAAIALAQVRLIADQNEGAITTLTAFLKENPPPEYAAPANGLLGTAYENTGKFAQAVDAYRKSAETAKVPYLKVSALLDAARASRNAGKKDEAIKILKEIVEKYPDTGGVTEAQLMLGELTGGKTS